MNNLDLLEAHRPFVVMHAGAELPLFNPLELGYRQILTLLEYEDCIISDVRLPEWKRDLVFDMWRGRYDMPDFQDARRLIYMIERYYTALLADVKRFYSADLSQLWEDRSWRTILAYIDNLPAGCASSAALSDDEEHAKMVAEAVAEREVKDGLGENEKSVPPSFGWTREVELMTGIRDDISNLTHAVIAVMSTNAGDPPQPHPRPESALENALKSARYNARKKKHEALANRVIRGRKNA